MPIKQIQHNSAEYRQMVALRYEILRKPLGLEFQPEELEREKEDILIGSFDEDELLGCCLLTRLDKETVKLRQMAVQNNLQGKGIGELIVHFAENLARDRGYRVITMHARDSARGFYEKLGYEVVGDGFIEVKVPHHQMQKKLM